MRGRGWTTSILAALLAVPLFGELAYDGYLLDVGESDGIVLHGKLTEGDVQELVVFTDGGEGRERHMTVYAFNGADWGIVHAADVPDDVIFVDMLATAGRDRLLMFRRGHVEWLNPADWTRAGLVSGASVYNVPPLDVPRVPVARDVNGDGRGDLVLADFDGYWVWLHGGEGGGWTGGVKLGSTPTAITGLRSAAYRPRPIYELDYDGDGRRDLAFWEDDRFLVYRATATAFETRPLELASPVDFASDDLAISIGFGSRRNSDKERTTLYGVDDYNGDGVGDLATTTLTVEGLLDQSTRYDFYFGTRMNGATRFAATPDTVIESAGIQGPFDTGDFDNDGRMDFGMVSFDIGIGKIIAALLTGSVSFDVDFYVMRDNAYPEKPNVSKPIRFRFSLGSGAVTSGRWIEVGDVTGDGMADLLVPARGKGIEVFPGTGDARLFSNEAQLIPLDFPERTLPGGVDVVDLNEDGRDDIVIRFPGAEEGEPNRVGVVLSE